MNYNRYDNGKIYQIINNIDDMVYIGSTCLPLRKRFYNHKKEHHAGKNPNRRLFVHAQKYGWAEFDIILIEEYPCDNNNQLRKREEYHRKLIPREICLNMYRAFQTIEDKRKADMESRQRCKERYNAYQRKYSQLSHAKAYSKQWEEDNKERRTQYKRDLHQYQCSWGGNPRNQNCLIKIDPTLFN